MLGKSEVRLGIVDSKYKADANLIFAPNKIFPVSVKKGKKSSQDMALFRTGCGPEMVNTTSVVS